MGTMEQDIKSFSACFVPGLCLLFVTPAASWKAPGPLDPHSEPQRWVGGSSGCTGQGAAGGALEWDTSYPAWSSLSPVPTSDGEKCPG